MCCSEAFILKLSCRKYECGDLAQAAEALGKAQIPHCCESCVKVFCFWFKSKLQYLPFYRKMALTRVIHPNSSGMGNVHALLY